MIGSHAAQSPAPHDALSAWNMDPLLIGGFLAVVWAYHRGRPPGRRRAGEARCFYAGIAALALALLSPLDAVGHALASAHMVQHILIVLVAAPLLAFSAPAISLLRGSPPILRRQVGKWWKRFGITTANTRVLKNPAVVWLLHAGTLWFWHAAVPYNAAVEHRLVHALEHTSFLVTGIMFWRVAIGSRYSRQVSAGLGILLVFSMAIQSGFLSALLTFARTPWYGAYASSTGPWNLEPLADQQLAGVIMWIPAGLVYLAAALALLSTWLADTQPMHGGQVLDPMTAPPVAKQTLLAGDHEPHSDRRINSEHQVALDGHGSARRGSPNQPEERQRSQSQGDTDQRHLRRSEEPKDRAVGVEDVGPAEQNDVESAAPNGVPDSEGQRATADRRDYGHELGKGRRDSREQSSARGRR